MMTLNELCIAISGQLVGASGNEHFEEISTGLNSFDFEYSGLLIDIKFFLLHCNKYSLALI